MRAVWLAVAAYFTLSTSDIMVKSVAGQYPVATIIFFNMVFAFIPCGIFIARHGGVSCLKPQKLPFILLIGLFGACGATLFFHGVKVMPMADIYAIAFANPLFATLLSSLFLGEKIGHKRGIALLAGFAAILFMIQPNPSMFNQSALLPLGAALCFACSTTINRYVSRYNKPPVLMIINNLVVMAGMLVVGQWTGFAMPAWTDMPHFALNGLVGGIGQCLILAALGIGPTIRVTPVMFSQILWGAVYGFILWHEKPSMTTLLGAPVLVMALIYIVRHPVSRPKSVTDTPLPVVEAMPSLTVTGALHQSQVTFKNDA